mgnify:FL=1
MDVSIALGVEIGFATLLMGMALGLVGAGGAGVVIALLTFGFGIPIHVALGVSLASMAFTTLAGTISHHKEGNVTLKTGIAFGLFGAVGAFFGTHLATLIPGTQLHYFTGGMLIITSGLIYLKVYHPNDGPFKTRSEEVTEGTRFWVSALVCGLICGVLSGTFGIGATPFIQLILMVVFGLSLFKTVGTTMLVILPIAVSGGIGYFLEGNLNFILLVAVLIGLTLGAYIGAKGTRRVPKWFLQFMMVATPFLGGVLLLIK